MHCARYIARQKKVYDVGSRFGSATRQSVKSLLNAIEGNVWTIVYGRRAGKRPWVIGMHCLLLLLLILLHDMAYSNAY
jgi:hypothetical protein